MKPNHYTSLSRSKQAWIIYQKNTERTARIRTVGSITYYSNIGIHIVQHLRWQPWLWLDWMQNIERTFTQHSERRVPLMGEGWRARQSDRYQPAPAKQQPVPDSDSWSGSAMQDTCWSDQPCLCDIDSKYGTRRDATVFLKYPWQHWFSVMSQETQFVACLTEKDWMIFWNNECSSSPWKPEW